MGWNRGVVANANFIGIDGLSNWHGVQPTIFCAHSSLFRTQGSDAVREMVGWTPYWLERARKETMCQPAPNAWVPTHPPSDPDPPAIRSRLSIRRGVQRAIFRVSSSLRRIQGSDAVREMVGWTPLWLDRARKETRLQPESRTPGCRPTHPTILPHPPYDPGPPAIRSRLSIRRGVQRAIFLVASLLRRTQKDLWRLGKWWVGLRTGSKGHGKKQGCNQSPNAWVATHPPYDPGPPILRSRPMHPTIPNRPTRESRLRPYLKKFNRACRFVSGCGGHPGMNRSTGMMLPSPSLTSGLP